VTANWEPWVVILAAIVSAGAYLLLRRHAAKPVIYANEREELLVRRVAQMVGCSAAQALPAVRREFDLSPNQPDDTLVKRAAYHYRQALPESTCRVYRDLARG
jgi:hypothetical protein